MDQWPYVIAGVAVLLLVGWRMRGRNLLAALVFGLAFAVVVVWLDRSGAWPDDWRR